MRTGRSVSARRLRAYGLPAHGPESETAHGPFRCFCTAKKRPPALQQAFGLRIPAFRRMPSIQHNPPLAPTTNGGLLLDRSFQYALPLAFLGYRPDAGETGELRGLPIHKTSVHADVCSGCYQNSILVWLIIVRCVSSLGSSGVSRFEEFLDSERCRDDWESLS